MTVFCILLLSFSWIFSWIYRTIPLIYVSYIISQRYVAEYVLQILKVQIDQLIVDREYAELVAFFKWCVRVASAPEGKAKKWMICIEGLKAHAAQIYSQRVDGLLTFD